MAEQVKCTHRFDNDAAKCKACRDIKKGKWTKTGLRQLNVRQGPPVFHEPRLCLPCGQVVKELVTCNDGTHRCVDCAMEADDE